MKGSGVKGNELTASSETSSISAAFRLEDIALMPVVTGLLDGVCGELEESGCFGVELWSESVSDVSDSLRMPSL